MEDGWNKAPILLIISISIFAMLISHRICSTAYLVFTERRSLFRMEIVIDTCTVVNNFFYGIEIVLFCILRWNCPDIFLIKVMCHIARKKTCHRHQQSLSHAESGFPSLVLKMVLLNLGDSPSPHLVWAGWSVILSGCMSLDPLYVTHPGPLLLHVHTVFSRTQSLGFQPTAMHSIFKSCTAIG